ncbi:MAG TPA: hypothetical protein VN704_13740 [Verrucomicrobiae bacterium]|nr:hypothetical protein [Verrucomicrobiae bacterium]
MIKEKIKITSVDKNINNHIHKKNNIHLNYRRMDFPSSNLLTHGIIKELIFDGYVYYHSFSIKIPSSIVLIIMTLQLQ